jgi:rhodanese-related sulfurtransferase
LQLESTPKTVGPAAPEESRKQAEELALRIAEEEEISWISAGELIDSSLGNNPSVTYLIDVRSEAEYESGHISGSLNVPGGQAVQRADDFIAVRNGKIIFVSNQSARAVMAAYWYGQMGFHDVGVLRGGVQAWGANGGALASAPPQSEPLGFEDARRIARMLQAGEVESLVRNRSCSVLHVGSSADFEAAHLPGSKWISRGWLELELSGLLTDLAKPIVLSCRDGRSSVLASRTLREIGYQEVFVLVDGVRAWTRAGYSAVKGLDGCLVEPNDVVLSPSVKGDKEAMRRYLEWETKLQQ